MTITELRTKRATAWDAAKAFLDSHRNDKGVLSAEDDATYSRMESEITDLGKEIARMERLEAMDKEMSRATSTPLTSKPDSAKADVKVLPIFDLIQKTGNIPERDMYNTYNMGVGMSVVVPANEVETALEILKANGEDAYVIGEIIKSDEGVILC